MFRSSNGLCSWMPLLAFDFNGRLYEMVLHSLDPL